MGFQDSLPGTGEALSEKIAKAIERVRLFAPKDAPYWGCFSGGKDSVVLKWIVEQAGVPCDWHYAVTTVDPPEVVRFIRKQHPDVKFDRPNKPMWARIKEKRMPPLRQARWCCAEYKETAAPKDRRLLIGVRWAESPRRAKAWTVVSTMRKQTIISPIVDFSDGDVWEVIRGHNLPYCSLYDEGFKRLGCILCPMARARARDIERWPNIARLWKKGIFAAWEARRAEGLEDTNRKWKTPEAMWEWWIGDGRGREGECQGLGLFADGNE